MRCLNSFRCEKALNTHQEYCYEYEAVKIELPKKGTLLEFKNCHRSEKVPFIVYADFESYIQPIQSCDPNPESSYTKQYQKHEPSSFFYYIKCFNDNIYPPKLVTYTGENVAENFVKMLEKDIREIKKIRSKEMIFGDEDCDDFNEATHCWICKKEIDDDDKKNYKVRDHCYFTGMYRGAAHNLCNLKYNKPNVTPVVFHNLSGYDSHLFIKKKILVLLRKISNVFPTMKKGILASPKKYKLEVI